MLNKKWFLMAGILGCLSLPLSAYAAEEIPSAAAESAAPEQATAPEVCQIYAYYSDGIPVQMGDEFYIEYQDAENVLYSMVIDASQASQTPLDIEMIPGVYIITNVTYVGYNSEIPASGYCMTTDFSVGGDGINGIQLGIGEAQAERVNTEYRNTLYIKNGQSAVAQDGPTNSQEAVVDIPVSSEEGTEPVTEPAEESQDTEDTMDSPEDPGDDTVEKGNEEKNRYHISARSLLIQNIPVFLILAAILAVTIRHRREQKKIDQ
ncbi:MAG: hypothetical protein MR936_18435 [Eubacterium sp.]|nr:hypothetical protein [Eubacterium sp.]